MLLLLQKKKVWTLLYHWSQGLQGRIFVSRCFTSKFDHVNVSCCLQVKTKTAGWRVDHMILNKSNSIIKGSQQALNILKQVFWDVLGPSPLSPWARPQTFYFARGPKFFKTDLAGTWISSASSPPLSSLYSFFFFWIKSLQFK